MNAWFYGLQPRGRWIVGVGLVAAVLIVLWAFVFKPVWSQSQSLQTAVESKQRLLVDLARIAGEQTPLTYGGNVQAQIDYSAISSRWKLPARYYSFEQKIDDNTMALFVVIDSNPFLKSYLIIDKENDELDSSAVVELRKQDTELQLKWLDSVLAHSNAKWKIVSAHHPVYSGGEHGDTPELIEQVKPILVKNNVNLYLCGHDHDMQHIANPESKVNYFVAGTGSK